MRLRLIIISILLSITALRAQSGVGLLFYDVDRLYDTIPALFYDDSDFTPNGRMHWNTARYRRKVEAVASVLDSAAMPLVGLYGVENEGVVRDIQSSCSQDYSVVHTTRNSLDGLDFALLYYGDLFYVEQVSQWRNMMVVEGDYCGTDMTIILASDGRDVEGYLADNKCADVVVVAGDISHHDIESWGFHNLHHRAQEQGWGNACSAWGWYFKHRIAVNIKPSRHESGAYIASYLLTEEHNSIFATFKGVDYLGGYSNYLPIYAHIFY